MSVSRVFARKRRVSFSPDMVKHAMDSMLAKKAETPKTTNRMAHLLASLTRVSLSGSPNTVIISEKIYIQRHSLDTVE
jgi:hypothetical protein